MNRFLPAIGLFYLITVSAAAQVMTKTNVFSVASPYLETSQQIYCIPAGNSHFISLSKVKGTQIGTSDFVLEKYDMNLAVVFSVPLTANLEEDFKEIHLLDQTIFLFSEIHDLLNKKKALKVYQFNAENGSKISDKIVHEQVIKDWLVSMGKGATKESFENAVSSGLVKNFNTPLEYQYTITFSPDKKNILVYTYDYGQKMLSAYGLVLDRSLAVRSQGVVPIDNNFVNYGLYVNNTGQIFIVNSDRSGRIVVIRYDLTTRDNIFLDIQSSSSKREGLKFQFLNDDEVYVASMATANKKIMGIMYAKFNFKDSIVDKLNYYDISNGLKATATALRSSNKSVTQEENWMNFQITDFYVNEYEKIVLVLEKKELEIININFDASATNDVKNWSEKLGKVHAEAMIIMSFNKNEELIWENYYLKSQINDITGGILSSSYCMNISEEGKIRMIYSASDNSTGVYNQIHYVEWDELNGNKIKDITLQNDEGFSMLRNYTVWWETRLVIAGRKGLLGKKTTVNLYSLEGKS